MGKLLFIFLAVIRIYKNRSEILKRISQGDSVTIVPLKGGISVALMHSFSFLPRPLILKCYGIISLLQLCLEA